MVAIMVALVFIALIIPDTPKISSDFSAFHEGLYGLSLMYDPYVDNDRHKFDHLCPTPATFDQTDFVEVQLTLPDDSNYAVDGESFLTENATQRNVTINRYELNRLLRLIIRRAQTGIGTFQQLLQTCHAIRLRDHPFNYPNYIAIAMSLASSMLGKKLGFQSGPTCSNLVWTTSRGCEIMKYLITSTFQRLAPSSGEVKSSTTETTPPSSESAPAVARSRTRRTTAGRTG
ncbi:hypothetical protein 1 [Jingmen tombus-like virus 2]|uniref:hypothetical protein 1 n=1 Tax=Jingmen tombus-like virus 2 TaxID=1938656 RepID=UPI0009093FA0|nr:hypothetical protein 1 [Jingmen tombus-like virus 2]APG76304.1 hypothetical protein 1 [Jingmen tombus-like virus 2]